MTLYNLNYNVPINKAGFLEEEQRFYAQETGHSEEKQDIQVRISNIKAGKITKENIRKLYQHFGYDSVFSRADVLEIIGITASPASELLRKMKIAGLIGEVRGQGKGRYKFIGIVPEEEDTKLWH